MVRSGGVAGHQGRVRVLKMATKQRVVTREQALAWRPWSTGDLRLIEVHLDRTGVTTFVETDGLIRCSGEAGRTLLDLHPGYIDLKAATALRHGDETQYWIILSTFQNRDDSPREEARSGEVCTECWIERSLTGACAC